MLLIILGAQPEKILVFGETGMKASDSHCFLPKSYMLNAEEYSKVKRYFKSRLLCSATTILFLKCLPICEQDQELCEQKYIPVKWKKRCISVERKHFVKLLKSHVYLLNFSWNKTV